MAPPIGNQGIYKITSPTGRVYVGQSVDIKTRFAKYRGLHCKGQRRLYASFEKHGIDFHDFDVIEVVQDINSLTERERFWQEHYSATGPLGLNCKLVTNNCHTGRHSEETRKLMSESAKGKKASESTREKMRRAKLGRKMPEEQRLSMIGRKASQETKDKMSKRMMGNAYTAGVTPVNAKKVVCGSTGMVFDKIADAAIFCGIKRTTLAAKLRGQSPNDTSMRYL